MDDKVKRNKRITNMTEQPSSEIQDIAQTIERYLSAHPNAVDTVDGITNDWLKTERVMAAPRQIQQAVSLLVDRGLLYQRYLPDGTTLYQARSRE